MEYASCVVASPVEARVTGPDRYAGGYNQGALSHAWHTLGYADQWGEYRRESSALTYSAVWGCVRVISQALASVGWHVYDHQGERRERIPAAEDDVAWVLDMQASPEMRAVSFREVLLKDALLGGNGYAEIERDGMGRVRWLWRLDPARVSLERSRDGRLYYEVRGDAGGETVALPPEDVYHLPGLSDDGLVGYSVVSMARRTIALGMREEQFGEQFYGRGPTPGGVLKIPGGVTPEAKEVARRSFEQTYGGTHNAGRVVVLTGGMEFTPLTVSAADAEFLASRKFQVTEVCRWFGVPPHKLADLDRATFSNIEEQEIAFVRDCLLPWARRLESEADVKLFGRTNRGRRFTRLNLDALMRGNSQTQTTVTTSKVTNGLLTINEGRAYFDLNPIEGGDTPLIQGAMVPLERLLEEPEPPPPALPPVPPEEDAAEAEGEGEGEEMAEEGGGSGPDMSALRTAFAPLFGNVYAHLLRADEDKCRRARNKGNLESHLAGYYDEAGLSRVAGMLQPLFEAALLAARRSPTAAPELAAAAAGRHAEWCRAAARRDDGADWAERIQAALGRDTGEVFG